MKSIILKMANAVKIILLASLLSISPPIATQTQASSSCEVVGLKQGTNATLRNNLCKMSQELGPVEVTSSCRTRKANRSVKRSLHLYHRGCKAADIVIKGVSKQTILNWWGKNVGGGRGYYCGRRFVHVDVGENRTWRWYCG